MSRRKLIAEIELRDLSSAIGVEILRSGNISANNFSISSRLPPNNRNLSSRHKKYHQVHRFSRPSQSRLFSKYSRGNVHRVSPMNETNDYCDAQRIIESNVRETRTWPDVLCRLERLERPTTEVFLTEPSTVDRSPPSTDDFFSFFHFYLVFLWLPRQLRVSLQWLRVRGRLSLLASLLPFSLPSRESADVRQLGSLAPPAAITTTIITGFFVLSSGFGLSSGWHVHPPTWHVTKALIRKKKKRSKGKDNHRIPIVNIWDIRNWFLTFLHCTAIRNFPPVRRNKKYNLILSEILICSFKRIFAEPEGKIERTCTKEKLSCKSRAQERHVFAWNINIYVYILPIYLPTLSFYKALSYKFCWCFVSKPFNLICVQMKSILSTILFLFVRKYMLFH